MVFVTLVLNLARPNSWKERTQSQQRQKITTCQQLLSHIITCLLGNNKRPLRFCHKSFSNRSFGRQRGVLSCCILTLCIMLQITEWQIGGRASLSDATNHFPWAVTSCGTPLYSTDLNSSSETVDIGRDPSFSFYLCPAAILRVGLVLAPLFHRLEKNKQKHHEAALLFCAMLSVWGSNCCGTMRRAWLMFHVSVVMVLFWGSTIESSMMYAELAMCFGRYRSIQRGARLVLVNRRLEMRQLVGVTSRKMMSSVKTWLLWEKKTEINND